MSKWRIFMSYSHTDDEICLMYKHALRARELEVWSDHEALRFRPSLTEEIENQLARCNGFIVLVSQNSLQSDWVMRECQVYANFWGGGTERNRDRKIIVVIIGALSHKPFGLIVIESSADRVIDANATSHDAAIEAIISEFEGAHEPLLDDIPAVYLTPYRQEKYGFQGLIKGTIEVVIQPTCDIDAGFFHIGSDKRLDINYRDDETPLHGIHSKKFSISTYSITVAEYLCAIQASAVPSSLYWDEQIKRSKNPVVNVSWYEALAYARWLSAVTKESWRLPTEAEWEIAARGTTGLIYSWGNEWDQEKAGQDSYDVSGKLRLQSTVDLASNISPCGAIGMCGNIWEWCSSLYKPYPYTAKDGREDLTASGARVARGGSFLETATLSRAASRSKLEPHLYFPDRGFRLVKESTSFEGSPSVGRIHSFMSRIKRTK